MIVFAFLDLRRRKAVLGIASQVNGISQAGADVFVEGITQADRHRVLQIVSFAVDQIPAGIGRQMLTRDGRRSIWGSISS